MKAERQLFLLDGEIWLRRRGETRFHKGETVTDFAADVALRRAALRARALTDETPHDLVLDLREAADRAFVAERAEVLAPTEQAGYYRATLTKAETVALADRGIAMATYPRFPGAGAGAPDEEEEAKAPAAKAEGGQATLATEVLFEENFEVFDFPGTRWTVGDENATSGDDFWEDININNSPSCRAHTGVWTGWSAGTGDQTRCTTYDNDMLAFMQTTNAIDVSAYEDVIFSYWLWYEVEQSFDFFRFYYSVDGVTWTLVSEFDGSVDDPAEGEWVEQAFELTGFTDFYMRFEFLSDVSNVEEGAYVDDILVTGNRLFEQNTAISSVLTGVWNSSVAWGDYDNDGDLDILLTGIDASNNRISAVYENDPVGTFTEETTISSMLTGVRVGSVAWGDYDNDGDLDILLTGRDVSDNRISAVYENVGGFPANTPPAAPTNLAATPTDTAALLSWDAATDTATLTDGLAYTLRIGTSPGGFDVMAPMSIVNTTTGAGKTAACSPSCPEGYRKIVSLSPVRPAAGGGRPSWQVAGLTPGTTYHWSVQALDGAFAGGAFAAEGSFATTTGTTTRYVSTTGSDAGNNCLVMASPCRTVGHAVGQAQAGDTIQVAAGTYAEPGLVIDKVVLFAGAGVVIQ